MQLCDQGGRRACEGGAAPLPGAWGPADKPLPRLAAGPHPLSSLLLFLFIFFLGVGFKLSCFVYITPKFCGIKDLQVQICPAFINFPSLFNLCDFNFPSLYC